MYQLDFLMNVISNQTSSVKKFSLQSYSSSKVANKKTTQCDHSLFSLLFLSSSSLFFFPFLFLCLYGFRKYHAQKTPAFWPLFIQMAANFAGLVFKKSARNLCRFLYVYTVRIIFLLTVSFIAIVSRVHLHGYSWEQCSLV